MLQVGFEPVQNLSEGFAEWSCAVVKSTTSQRHKHARCTLKIINQHYLKDQMRNELDFKAQIYCLQRAN